MPVTERRLFFVNQPSFRRIMQFLMILVLTVSNTILCAQTVMIKLVNGKTGRPVAAACLFVSVENDPINIVPLQPRDQIALITDKDGIASLRLTSDNNNRGEDCGLHDAIKTDVKYGDTLWISVNQYLLCQPHTSGYSWKTIQNISTKQLVNQGFVAPNSCGKLSALPKPGELTIFVRPLHWWEGLND